MPVPTTTTHAAPSADNLLLGKGIVYFNRFDSSGLATGLVDMGNVDTFELTTEDTKLTKNSSRDKTAGIYKEITQKRTTTLTLKGDEFSPDNVALALMGDVVSVNQAATAITGEVLTTNAKLGGIYKVAKYGAITGVTVKKASSSMVLGTDYVVHDAANGLIRLLKTSSTIVDGDTLTIDYTPTAISALTRLRAGVSGNIYGSLVFIGDPSAGPKMEVHVWSVSVTPSGQLGLISEDFAQLGLTMTVQTDSVNHADSPLFDVVYL